MLMNRNEVGEDVCQEGGCGTVVQNVEIRFKMQGVSRGTRKWGVTCVGHSPRTTCELSLVCGASREFVSIVFIGTSRMHILGL